MMSDTIGAVSEILKHAVSAIHTPCYNHSFNWSISQFSKVQAVGNVVGSMQEIKFSQVWFFKCMVWGESTITNCLILKKRYSMQKNLWSVCWSLCLFSWKKWLLYTAFKNLTQIFNNPSGKFYDIETNISFSNL